MTLFTRLQPCQRSLTQRTQALPILMAERPPQRRLQAISRHMNTDATEKLVLTESRNNLRILTLNRPKKYNALNAEMVHAIYPALKEWEESSSASVVLLKGNGKAFCAGGDVQTLVNAARSPETRHQASDFFRDEYECDNFIAKMRTPVVTFMNGITMGGGVGLSVHAAFKIATEKTEFAMPETTIGLFPDVGVNFLLSRLDGQIGLYLGLTSERLKGWDVFRAGVATHYVTSDKLEELEGRLAEMDLSALSSSKDGKLLDSVNAVIEEYTEKPSPELLEQYSLRSAKRTAIDYCFAPNTVEQICDNLQAIVDGKSFAGSNLERWAETTKNTIEHRSPTSCKVALMGLRKARFQDIDQVFQTDCQVAAAFSNAEITTDFVTGVDEVLGKKSKSRPAWKPSTLAETSENFIRQKFFEFNDSVQVPTLRIDTSRKPYTEYPHAQYALPSEEVIRQFVNGEAKSSGSTAMSRQEISENITRKWRNKNGVREKVSEVLDRKTKEGKNGSPRWDA